MNNSTGGGRPAKGGGRFGGVEFRREAILRERRQEGDGSGKPAYARPQGRGERPRRGAGGRGIGRSRLTFPARWATIFRSVA